MSPEAPVQQRRSKRLWKSDEADNTASSPGPRASASPIRKIAIPRGAGSRRAGSSKPKFTGDPLVERLAGLLAGLSCFNTTQITSMDTLDHMVEQVEQASKSHSEPVKKVPAPSPIDACIAELEAGLPYVSTTKYTPVVSQCLLDERKQQHMKPYASSSQPKTREFLRLMNCDNKLVSVLTIYGCQKIFARHNGVRSLINVARTCTCLWNDFNLADKNGASFDNWRRVAGMQPMFDPQASHFQISTKRKRCAEDDEDDLAGGASQAKRVMGSHFRVSAHGD